mgnify:CR=1 FL=1
MQDMIDKYGALCPYIQKCWRFVYSLELMYNPWRDKAPTREVLECSEGKTCPGHSKRGAMFAEFFPWEKNGKLYNICPVIRYDTVISKKGFCFEYDKQKLKDNKRFKDRGEGFRRHSLRKSDYETEDTKLTSTSTPRLRSIPKQMRVDICARDKYRCVYCHRSIHQLKAIGEKFVYDHFMPLHKGGGNDFDNLVLACWKCNSLKSDQLWDKGCMIGRYQNES